MLATFDHDMTAYMLQAGTLIDDEAESEVEKRLLFDGRLDQYL